MVVFTLATNLFEAQAQEQDEPGNVGPQRIAIPAYWQSHTLTGIAMFDELVEASPPVGMVVVNGPQSAPPDPYDDATAESVRRLHGRGTTVLGYVDTGYLGRTLMTTTRVNPASTEIVDWQAQILADVSGWFDRYGPAGITGVFLDQTPSSCGPDSSYLAAYQSVTGAIRQAYPGAIIAINPGMSVDECYADVADVILIFENTYQLYQQWTPPAWVFNHDPGRFWHLIHGAATAEEMRDAIALSRQRHAGNVYVTSHTITATGSPWISLPDAEYWQQELTTFAANPEVSDSPSPSPTSAAPPPSPDVRTTRRRPCRHRK